LKHSVKRKMRMRQEGRRQRGNKTRREILLNKLPATAKKCNS
jgi:hypothetical protein